MRKILLLLSLIILLSPQAFALKGVGIVYGTVITNVVEGKSACFDYGVYNPWDEDVKVELTVSGELADLNPFSESVEVPGETYHNQAKQVQICFDIPRMYSLDCPETPTSLHGKIIATEWYPAGFEGTGSSTSVSAAAPLELIVQCDSEKGFQFNSTFFLVGVAIVGIGLMIYIMKKFFATHKIIKKK